MNINSRRPAGRQRISDKASCDARFYWYITLVILYYIMIDFEVVVFFSDTNKREAVFLTQCAAMFLLSAMFFLHHTPYFLMAMASFALCYRLLLGRVDLG